MSPEQGEGGKGGEGEQGGEREPGTEAIGRQEREREKAWGLRL